MTFPASPQLQVRPHAPMPSDAAGGDPGVRKRKMWIGIGAAMMVVGGAGSAILYTRNSHSHGSGAASPTGLADDRDGVVRATFASIGTGDLDALIKRSAPADSKTFETCDGTAEPGYDEHEARSLRAQLVPVVAAQRGATFEVVAITATEKPTRLAPGLRIRKGCTLDKPMTSNELGVQLKVTRDGATDEMTGSIVAYEVDNHWYVGAVPKLGDCAGAVDQTSKAAYIDQGDPSAVANVKGTLVERCTEDHWSATARGCLVSAYTPAAAQACFAALPPAQRDKVRDALTLLVDGPVGKLVKNLIPSKDGHGDPGAAGSAATATGSAQAGSAGPPPGDSTNGTPEQLASADLWLWTRSDGTFRVTSPLFDATFPHKPTVKVERSPTKTADGKAFDILSIVDDVKGGALLQIQVISLGRNAKDVGVIDKVKAVFAKVGPVTEHRRSEGKHQVVQLEATEAGSGAILRADVRLDLPHGMFVTATFAAPPDQEPLGRKFLDRFHPRDTRDPLVDPAQWKAIAVRKVGKAFVAHDSGDAFTIELPWPAKIAKLPLDPTSPETEVTVTSAKGRASVVVDIAELAAWDSFQLTPAKVIELDNRMKEDVEKLLGGKAKLSPDTVAGLPGSRIEPAGKSKKKIIVRSAWNRYQHRMYRVMCVDTPCDAVVGSLHFADPVPLP